MISYWIMPDILENDVELKLGRLEKEIVKEYKVTPWQLKSNTRLRHVVYPRQIMCYIMKQVLKMTYVDIGTYFNKNHATVIHAVKNIDNIMSYDKQLQKQLLELYKIV